MGRIHAGTSGWSYASWRPGFYPAELGPVGFLNYYASRLNSVEVNYTFGKIVSKDLLQRWAEATPPDFQFAVKAHRRITHSKRLRGAARLTKAFLASLDPLRKSGKLGPVLFQLPPNFKSDLGRLNKFLKCLPPGSRFALEFRHKSWFCEETYEALWKAGVALCQAESEKLVTPNVVTADFHYLRLRKENYSGGAVTQRIRELAQSGDVYVYFKHEELPAGALLAETLLSGAGRQYGVAVNNRSNESNHLIPN